jgi:hypothetical protein
MFVITLLAIPLLAAGRADTTEVVVQNNRDVPVTVYLEVGDEDVRLGTVSSRGDSILRVPSYLAVDDVKIFVEPAGELEESTGDLDLKPGEHLGVVVPAAKEPKQKHGTAKSVFG